VLVGPDVKEDKLFDVPSESRKVPEDKDVLTVADPAVPLVFVLNGP
jgi:hypothetical protein